MEPILEIKDLGVSFGRGRQQTQCADGVCLQVAPGEILALVGESGCGKSITAMSILGLLARQGRVTGGQILFEGRDLLTLNEKQLDEVRGRGISMIFQDIMYSLNPVFKIGTQMIEGMRKHLGYSKAQARTEAVELLKKTGIYNAEEVMAKYPHMLSGGMRQRVMIAMALSCRPKLLIADEPTTALDVTIQLQIMELLRRLRDETGMAILLITHDFGVVAEMADRVAVMYAGQVVEAGSTRSLLQEPAHPYTRALLQAIPGIADSRERRLYSIRGTVPEKYDSITGCRFAERCPFGGECPHAAAPCNMIPVEEGHLCRCPAWNQTLKGSLEDA